MRGVLRGGDARRGGRRGGRGAGVCRRLVSGGSGVLRRPGRGVGVLRGRWREVEAARLRHGGRGLSVRLLRGLLACLLLACLLPRYLRSLSLFLSLRLSGRGVGAAGLLRAGTGPVGPKPSGSGPIWSKTSTGSSSAPGSGSISTAAVSALRAPVAVRKRACGSGCNSPASTCQRGSGMPCGALGVPCEAKCSMSACESGFFPWSRYRATRPTAKRSAGKSGSAPIICSGAK